MTTSPGAEGNPGSRAKCTCAAEEESPGSRLPAFEVGCSRLQHSHADLANMRGQAAPGMWLTISRSVAIVIRLERPLLRQTEIFRLLARDLRQLHADLVEMQRGDFFVEMLRQRVDLLLISPCLVQSSICASVWLVNDADMTKEGWPVALPRLTSRPSDRRMMCLPSANSISSTCGLTLFHLKFAARRPGSRESKWPILQTMARSCIAAHVVDA